jgi:methylenetetrahydrofolate dehydrogenase (NADP+)/methenyltetrahydrofolate cyclohydrolase
MDTKIIDGAALARSLRAEVAERVRRSGLHPGLAVVLVGEDPASQVYVRNKIKGCAEAGIVSFEHRMPTSTGEAELLRLISSLNADPQVHGILVQLPLPGHVSTQKVIEAVHPSKDVDGFHPENLGLLASGHARFVACTPAGVLRLLDHAAVPLAGRHAVVVGRSTIVGKPAALLLLERNATVTICHSRTTNLAGIIREADIVVAAVGRARLIGGEMIKPGAAIIDVGINRLDRGPDAGKLCGDVDFAAAVGRAGWITPVPGGVGPMTIAMLLENTLRAAQEQGER